MNNMTPDDRNPQKSNPGRQQRAAQQENLPEENVQNEPIHERGPDVEPQQSKSSQEEAFPRLGIDLDGTIDEAPIFFRWLSQTWPGAVYIITYRKDRKKTEFDLARFEVRYDHLILVNSFSEKAEVITREGINFYFDDQDEMTLDIPEGHMVFKPRNGGNFCFDTKKWLYSDQTGRML